MREENLTQGPILRKLLLFALPMLAGNLLQQIYNIADTLIVGRYVGPEALAAVGASYTLMTFLTSVLIGLCMGSGSLFSVSFGRGEAGQIQTDVRLSLLFIGAITVFLTAAVYLWTDPILRLLSVPAEIHSLMKDYVRIVFAGLVFTALYNFFAYLLRGMGNSVTPLYFLFGSSVLNIALDLLFVIRFHWGVRGAAIATVLSQALCGIAIAAVSFWRLPYLRGLGKFAPRDGVRLLEIIRTDVLTALQQSVMNFGILMIQGLVNRFGVVIMAAFAAAVKIDTLAYMPAQEFGNAYSMFIAQNHGAGRKDRIRAGSRLAFLTSVVFCGGISLLIWFASPTLMGCFVDPGEREIIAAGVTYLRIEGAFYFGIGCLFLFYGLYRGIQRPGMSLVLTIVSLGTRVGLAYLLAPRFGVELIWWAIPIGWILADSLGLAYWRWLERRPAAADSP